MRRAHPAVIGGFILGAVVLIVAGVVIFGSGQFFRQTLRCVMYFEGAVQGLQEGAAVNFRGVRVGTVKDITMQFNIQNLEVKIPVVVEFAVARRANIDVINAGSGSFQEAMRRLITRGLRAQLQVDSLVTGLLFVQLDLYPESPPVVPAVDPRTNLLEIPTVPTTLQEASDILKRVMSKLAELPLEDMLRNIERTLEGIERLVNTPEIPEVFHNLKDMIVDVRHMVGHVDTQIAPLAGSVTTAMQSLTQLSTDVQQLTRQVDQQLARVASSATTTLGQVGKLASSTEKQVQALSTSLANTSNAVLATLEQARKTLATFQNTLAPNAPVGYELGKTLRELSEAARALRRLSEYLEQHPNALVFGRRGARNQ